MKFARRQFLHLAAGAAALPALSRGAAALDYPAQPVRIVVGFAPGGTTDVVARLIGQYLSERLGQPFIVENRPGAGTNIATEEVLHARPDGYTLLLVTVSNAINASLFKEINFNFLRDAASVAGIMQVPNVVVVNPAVPVKTLPEFIAYAKANPGKIAMASGGVGSSSHMSGELFCMMAGINLIHVPYRGEAPALNDMVSGQTQVMFDLLSASIGFIRDGKLRPLAVTSATPLSLIALTTSLTVYAFERSIFVEWPAASVILIEPSCTPESPFSAPNRVGVDRPPPAAIVIVPVPRVCVSAFE